jgi:hypothetical protein
VIVYCIADNTSHHGEAWRMGMVDRLSLRSWVKRETAGEGGLGEMEGG